VTDSSQQPTLLLPGTLHLLILKAVSLGPLHGYAVPLRIGQISGGAFLIEQGALYPALFRLVRLGRSHENLHLVSIAELLSDSRLHPPSRNGGGTPLPYHAPGRRSGTAWQVFSRICVSVSES
jgi:hypothetical protein